jgi:hypothetical protein
VSYHFGRVIFVSSLEARAFTLQCRGLVQSHEGSGTKSLEGGHDNRNVTGQKVDKKSEMISQQTPAKKRTRVLRFQLFLQHQLQRHFKPDFQPHSLNGYVTVKIFGIQSIS